MMACLNILTVPDDFNVTHNDLTLLGINFDKSKSQMARFHRQAARVYLISQFQLLDTRITVIQENFNQHTHILKSNL